MTVKLIGSFVFINQGYGVLSSVYHNNIATEPTGGQCSLPKSLNQNKIMLGSLVPTGAQCSLPKSLNQNEIMLGSLVPSQFYRIVSGLTKQISIIKESLAQICSIALGRRVSVSCLTL